MEAKKKSTSHPGNRREKLFCGSRKAWGAPNRSRPTPGCRSPAPAGEPRRDLGQLGSRHLCHSLTKPSGALEVSGFGFVVSPEEKVRLTVNTHVVMTSRRAAATSGRRGEDRCLEV